MIKIILFVFVTILCFIDICVNAMHDKWYSVLYFFLGYIVLILVALYEIGRIELENENKNSIK